MANPLYDRLFGAHAGRDTLFLIEPDGHRISHAAFLARAARLANTLTDLGLVAGDRVAAQIDKSADALALYAACVQAGLVFLPLNTAYMPAEVEYFVSNAGARLLVAAPTKAMGLMAIAEKHGARLETLGQNQNGTLSDYAAAAKDTFATVTRGADDLAAILYTSGTTGRSKGAMLSQGNLLSNAEVLAATWHFTAADRLLHALPIFHTHGLFVATNITLLAGGSMILLPKFDTDDVIRWLPEASTMMGVPTFYTRLLDDARFTHALVAHMRLFVSGSAPLLAETHRAFEDLTGHRILERYGMTETNMNTSNPYAGERRPGTVGPALPGVEVKVCDPAGKELPRGEIGVLEVRGPNVFMGYWQMPEKTAEELRPDGFFITGDLATQGADGYVTIVGRAKDLIISGGFNIYPKEIEEALDEMPGVLESAVIGVAHPDMGEGVVAVLAAMQGLSPDLDAIAAALADNLARFKLPRRYVVVDALPRNTMGKVQKAELRRNYGDSFASPKAP